MTRGSKWEKKGQRPWMGMRREVPRGGTGAIQSAWPLGSLVSGLLSGREG